MAIIKFSVVVGDARGKIGNTIFSRNAGGSYIRERVVPINPNTQLQQQVRARVMDLSKRYADLTFGLQLAWKNFSLNHPQTNKLGDEIILSAIAMYQKVNLILLNVGQPRRDTPPANAQVEPISSATITLEESGNLIGFPVMVPDPMPANHLVEVRITRPVSPGIIYVKNLFRFTGVSTVAESIPFSVNMSGDLAPLVLGELRHVSLRFVNILNGFQSETLEISAVVI